MFKKQYRIIPYHLSLLTFILYDTLCYNSKIRIITIVNDQTKYENKAINLLEESNKYKDISMMSYPLKYVNNLV